jgi:cyclase
VVVVQTAVRERRAEGGVPYIITKTKRRNKMKIIPCLDIRGGKVVKGVKFEGIREVGDPVELAAKYLADGADELVLYDISASIENRIVDLELVGKIASVINKKVDFTVAGGIGTIADFEKVLNAGATRVSVNSLAIRSPEIIREAAAKFGSKAVVVGIDACRSRQGQSRFAAGEPYKYSVMLSAGQEDSGLELIEWVKRVQELGAGEICLNSIDADGVKNGYDLEMLNAVCAVATVPVIASGGCGALEHFAEVFSKTKASAALAASVFHFGELTVQQIKEYLNGLK